MPAVWDQFRLWPSTNVYSEHTQDTCSSSNCATGCCMGNQCISSVGNNACGKNGAACQQCGQNYVCDTAAGACVLSPQLKWAISPVRAQITAQDINGAAWDFDGSPPDAMVTMICPPSSAPNVIVTPYVESYSPEWTGQGCVATTEALLSEPVGVKVEDYDPIGTNDLVANFTIQLHADQLSDQKELTIPPNDGLVSMTLRVTLVPSQP